MSLGKRLTEYLVAPSDNTGTPLVFQQFLAHSSTGSPLNTRSTSGISMNALSKNALYGSPHGCSPPIQLVIVGKATSSNVQSMYGLSVHGTAVDIEYIPFMISLWIHMPSSKLPRYQE